MALFFIQNINPILSQQFFGLYTVIKTETETLLQRAKYLDLEPKLKGGGVRITKNPVLTILKPLDH